VEHGLLLDNLLDLAHAPFTHTSTFAKGWSVPRFLLTLITLFSAKMKLGLSFLFLVLQFGEVFNTYLGSPRILGSISNRYGI